ncbi:MAG: cysteine desulfurase [Gemmatimonadetes bacterium]|nr:cysteine desulfurase [Gemmatimonadota bacterium]
MEEALVETPRELDDAVRLSDEHALRYRGDFPILDRKVHGKPLVYLDNSATSQKPRAVLDALDDYYTRLNANVHRGLHTLSEEATNAYEAAREKVARFINVPARSLVFVRNTTEGINLVASAWGRKNVGAGDEILLSVMEHHSNIVPWQMLARETGAVLRYFDIREDGSLDMDQADDLITERTRIVSIAHMSNVLGTVNPIEAVVERAHDAGALVFVDAAQSVPHMPVDAARLGCDFFAFSGHKMCGPTGIGGLYGRQELLEAMEPYMGGGSMIDEVRLDGFTSADIPEKFEAGTPNIAHAIVFSDVVDYLSAVGMDQIHTHERALTDYTIERLEEIDGLTVYGHAPGRGGAISFNLDNMHPSDLSTVLDRHGIAIRAGHHCAQPLMRRLGTSYGATARASLYFYNTSDEIDTMIAAIHRARTLFGA